MSKDESKKIGTGAPVESPLEPAATQAVPSIFIVMTEAY